MRRLNIRRSTEDAVALFVGLAARAASQLVLLVAYARFGGVDVSSTFALSLAIAAPFFVTLEMGLRTIYVTWLKPSRFAGFVWARLAAVCAAGMLSIGASAFAGIPVTVAILVALGKAIDSLTDIFLGSLQKRGRVRAMAGVLIVNGLLTVLAGTWVFYVTKSLVLSLMASAGASLTSLFTAVNWASRIGDGRWALNRSVLLARPERGLLASGLTLGLSDGLTSLALFTPTYILSATSTAENVSVYVLMFYFIVAFEMIMNAMVQSSLRSLSGLAQAAGVVHLKQLVMRTARRVSLVSFVLALPMVCGLALAVPRIIGNSTPVPWAAVPPLVVLVGVLPFVFYLAAFMSIVNRYSRQVVVALALVVMVISVGVIAIPLWTIAGASLTVLAGALTIMVLLTGMAGRETIRVMTEA